ncbi:MAG: hypothetical protein HXK70_06195 [Clostridiales bacterium]|jgi:hypothetical protein|nr:hypothetical protein [Clostridiales bacterium]
MIKNKINISMIIKLFICLILLIILTIFVVNKTFIKDNYKNIQIPRFSYFIKDKNQELELISIKSFKALKNYFNIENTKEFTLYTCNNHQLYFNMKYKYFIYDINIDNKGIYRRIKFKYSFEDNNKFCDNLK